MIHSLIFFDAECPLCWRSIAFVIKIDRAQRFLFAPLRGKTAEEYLHGVKAARRAANSMILIENCRSSQERIWLRGRAVFRILWLIGGVWRWLGWLSFVPVGVDGLYRLIARHRRVLKIEGSSQVAKENPERFLP